MNIFDAPSNISVQIGLEVYICFHCDKKIAPAIFDGIPLNEFTDKLDGRSRRAIWTENPPCLDGVPRKIWVENLIGQTSVQNIMDGVCELNPNWIFSTSTIKDISELVKN